MVSQNPKIAWQEAEVRVPEAIEPWPLTNKGTPALAGISAFGISGTNAHIIVGTAHRYVTPDSAVDYVLPQFMLPLSARSPSALTAWRSQLAQAIEEEADRLSPENVCAVIARKAIRF